MNDEQLKELAIKLNFEFIDVIKQIIKQESKKAEIDVDFNKKT